MAFRHLSVVVALLCSLFALAGCRGRGSSSGSPSISGAGGNNRSPAYPLKVSTNKRYLVDQNGIPTLVIGDGGCCELSQLGSSDWDFYITDRASKGMNAVWAFVLCGSVNKDGTNGCRSDLSTYDGIKPFTSGTDQTNYDVSTPNPTYWARVDSYIEDAATRGVQVLFLTWDAAGLMPLATFNGNTKMFNFGVFLGNRYKNFPNIIWWTGNDFQTWTTGLENGTSNAATAAANNAAMQNLMAGIASVDTNHLHVTELNYDVSTSADDSGLATYTTVEGLYDYFCPYSKAYKDYNNASRPLFFDEGFYEYGVYGNINGTKVTVSTKNVRTQQYWLALSGSMAGFVYGNGLIGLVPANWKSHLSTPGSRQLTYLTNFFKTVPWQNLVPDQSHELVTAGYGTQNTTDTDGNCINDNNYVTTAFDGSTTLISYAPDSTTLTLALSKFSSHVMARWFDPTNGTYQTASGSPFANSGTRNFATPGNNSAGDSDWVLVLTAQ